MNYCFVSRNTIIPYTKSLQLEIYLTSMAINNFENRRNFDAPISIFPIYYYFHFVRNFVYLKKGKKQISKNQKYFIKQRENRLNPCLFNLRSFRYKSRQSKQISTYIFAKQTDKTQKHSILREQQRQARVVSIQHPSIMYAYQSTRYPVPLNISKIIYAFSNKFHSHQTGILRIVRDRDSTSVSLGQIFEIPIKIGSTYHVQLTFRMKSFRLSLSLSPIS